MDERLLGGGGKVIKKGKISEKKRQEGEDPKTRDYPSSSPERKRKEKKINLSPVEGSRGR